MTSKAPQHSNRFKGAVHNRSYSACSNMRIRLELNVSSEEKCLQRRLETVPGWRVVNGTRQPVPAAGPATTNARPPNFVLDR